MTRHRQCGVAIITALLVVMLAAGIAAFLLAQQSRALTRAARATERAQAIQYAAPMLDWARAALFQLQKSTPRVDLTQPWARGLAAIPIDGAMAAGALRDEAGLFNINNLAKNGGRSEADIAVFRDLLTALKLNPDLADAAADWIDADDESSGAGGAENSTYMAMQTPYRAANRSMMQIEELRRARGFDDASLARLKPFVTALPLRTPININTAPQEVLAAAFPKLTTDDIAALSRQRLAKPFESKAAIAEYWKKFSTPLVNDSLDMTSQFFSVNIAIDHAGAQIRQSALLQRAAATAGTPATPGAAGEGAKWPSIIWVKTE